MEWANSSGGIFLSMTDTSLASLFSLSFSSRSTSSCKDSRITSLTFTPRLDSFFLSSAGTLAHTVSVAIRYYQNSITATYDKKITTILVQHGAGDGN